MGGRKEMVTNQANFAVLPSFITKGAGSVARKKPKRLGLGKIQKRLGGSMSRLAAKYSQRFQRVGGAKNKVRAVQAGNLSGMMKGKLKKPKIAKYFSPVSSSATADFAKPIKRQLGLVQKVARAIAKSGSVPESVKQGGRGVVSSKRFKPAKPKKKLKAKKVKGTRGYRGLKGAPPPLTISTAFNPSPFGGAAKTLGIKT